MPTSFSPSDAKEVFCRFLEAFRVASSPKPAQKEEEKSEEPEVASNPSLERD